MQPLEVKNSNGTEVADLDYELANRDFKVITEPNPPAEGIRVAMIEHNGAPIELIEFEKNKVPTPLTIGF